MNYLIRWSVLIALAPYIKNAPFCKTTKYKWCRKTNTVRVWRFVDEWHIGHVECKACYDNFKFLISGSPVTICQILGLVFGKTFKISDMSHNITVDGCLKKKHFFICNVLLKMEKVAQPKQICNKFLHYSSGMWNSLMFRDAYKYFQ